MTIRLVAQDIAMPRRDPERSAGQSAPAPRLAADDLALRLGVGPERVRQLADVGAIDADADDLFDPGDVHRVRLLLAFEEAGVPIEALLAASQAGAISLRYYDQLHPPPAPLSGRSYGELKASAGRGATHLSQLFAAFGLAEPEPDSRLTVEDEQFVTDMLATVVETGQPDLALRAIRLYGEGARRAADGALGVYGEAVDRAGDNIQGLPVDDVFERLLRPWARYAQQSGRLAAWLASHHLSRAIDEYSVTQTERVLETAGFVVVRPDAQPAVAFIDLTGFTRLTEERGDEVAAAMAMRLGELTTDTVRPQRGRIVKLLGDGVLVRFDDPVAAAAGTLDLLAALPAAGLPSAHAGLASGPLIVRDGDIFGRTVNLAARIADAAPDGRLYVPEDVASSLGGDLFRLQPAGDAHLQGIGRIALVDVGRPRRSPGD
jgi:adenylate cyclase